MDFAPYQDTSPETARALSPPPPRNGNRDDGRRRSFSPPPRSPLAPFSPPLPSPGAGAGAVPSRGNAVNPWANIDETTTTAAAGTSGGFGGAWGGGAAAAAGGGGGGGGGGRDHGGDVEEAGRGGRLNEFETSLPLRLDYEACMAYLLLPPAGGVLLLVLEHKSDYVRFHAWQSSLLFSTMFVLHLLFSWWTTLSWIIFVADLALIAYLTWRAYKDADTLDRCEIPFFGRLASRILDDE